MLNYFVQLSFFNLLDFAGPRLLFHLGSRMSFFFFKFEKCLAGYCQMITLLNSF